MLVFWEAQLVLLAVPKTAATALETAFLPHADASILHPPGLRHANVRRWRGQLGRVFEQNGARPMELVAVMREPVSWLSSWHRYRSRPALKGRPQSTEGLSFADFVAAWLEEEPPEYARVGRQARFLAGDDGSLGVDHLFRHDHLGEAVAFLEGRLGVSVTIDRLNVSPEDADLEMPDALRQRLEREAVADFDLWENLRGGSLSEAAARRSTSVRPA